MLNHWCVPLYITSHHVQPRNERILLCYATRAPWLEPLIKNKDGAKFAATQLRVSGFTTTVKNEMRGPVSHHHEITNTLWHMYIRLEISEIMMSSPSFSSSPDPTSQNSRLKECTYRSVLVITRTYTYIYTHTYSPLF